MALALPLNTRVNLRPLSPDDLPDLIRWDQDNETSSLIGGRRFEAVAPEIWLSRYRHGRALAFAITTTDGRLIGDLQLQEINWRRREAELRICLGEKELWGQGLGPEAINLVLGLAFTRLRLKQVYLRVHTGNRRAVGCYKKCGFRTIGRLPLRGEASGDLLLMLIRADAHAAAPDRLSPYDPWSKHAN